MNEVAIFKAPFDDIVASPPSPNPRKRTFPEGDSPSKKPLNLKGDQFVMPTPPDTDNSSPSAANNNDRAVSPESSALSSVGDAVEGTTGTPGSAVKHAAPESTPAASGQPPAKKRKLTLAEKAEKEREKAVKARERAEAKAKREEDKVRKEEEKRVKDEEKRVRDLEKQKKAEEKEEKKREKELEKEREEQAKLKKQQSQMRLGAFFQKPATPVKQDDSGAAVQGTAGSARRKSLSLEPFDALAEQTRKDEAAGRGTPRMAGKQTRTDYHKHFLPFELPSHTTLAPTLQFDTSQRDADAAQVLFDSELNDPSLQEKYDLGLTATYASIESHFANERAERGLRFTPVVDLIKAIHGTSQQPIDLTTETQTNQPLDLLREIPIRHLHFYYDDVRPAYYGSYTKIKSSQAASKLRRNPFAKERKDTDYDYDSEVEWEEGEEAGEDLMSDGEDDAESQGDAEDADFLDDEDDALKHKRKAIVTDLVPVSTGVCWQDGSRKLHSSDDHPNAAESMKGMSLGFLLPGLTAIDPFSTAYWQDTQAAPASAMPGFTPASNVHPLMNSTMPPPRQPLQNRNTNTASPSQPLALVGAAEGMKGPIDSVAATQSRRAPKASPRSLSTEEMDDFKDAVVGSGLKKADMQKGLKDRFPKMTQEVIKATLSEKFAQVGSKRGEKRWVYVGDP